MKTCTVTGCEKKHHANGFCTLHNQRMAKHGTLDAPRCADGTPEERFWRHAGKAADHECWNWQSVTTAFGYGRLKVAGKFVQAHRFSFTLHGGEIAPGLVVMHCCDNPRCVNPGHLVAGTQKQNLEDRNQKGRRVTRRGDDSPVRKIDESDVAAIRASTEAQPLLAGKYGVSQSLISMIRNGRRRTAQIRT